MLGPIEVKKNAASRDPVLFCSVFLSPLSVHLSLSRWAEEELHWSEIPFEPQMAAFRLIHHGETGFWFFLRRDLLLILSSINRRGGEYIEI